MDGQTKHADRYFLTLALAQAESRKGWTWPNPAVGAVLVKNGQVLALGTHWQAGAAHAEVVALAQVAGDTARGATLYVTLEPCCHYGKTPPCVNAILEAGIVRVVYAQIDPNPLVAGQGQAQLAASGVLCEQLPLPEISEFYRSYVYRIVQRRPWVCGKLALSLDGKSAGVNGRPLAISGVVAHEFTHQQRLKHDAILTSLATIACDDPQLNVRLPGVATQSKPVIVLDSRAQLSFDAAIWHSAARVIVVHDAAAPWDRVRALQEHGATTMSVVLRGNHLDLAQVLSALADFGFHDLWLEAGGTLLAAFADQALLNEAYCYVAAWWAGAVNHSAFITANFFKQALRRRWQALGDDALLHLEFC